MGKPKKSSGAPRFSSSNVDLNTHQKGRILDLLGYSYDDPSELENEFKERGHQQEALFSLISFTIGAYSGAEESLDNAPRPATYRKEIGAVKKQSNDLLQELCGLSYWMRENIKSRGYDVYNLERELGKFFDTCYECIEELSRNDSRGGNKKQALQALVNNLREFFKKYYNSELDKHEEEAREEDSRKRSGRSEAEIQFVSFCLEIAEISQPNRITEYFTDTPDLYIQPSP